jgi:hypothetical protein
MIEKLGRYGHHPDPVIDFCIECDVLEAMEYNRYLGLVEHEYERRLEAALDFQVGGDIRAVDAKNKIRALKEQGGE